ncbi:hypothetical protein C2E23DRAFT_856903 [Lenzites betulinus]|nr:hypothetical protein C2E23DRAFT_856903 [Lenzites betulinus]
MASARRRDSRQPHDGTNEQTTAAAHNTPHTAHQSLLGIHRSHPAPVGLFHPGSIDRQSGSIFGLEAHAGRTHTSAAARSTAPQEEEYNANIRDSQGYTARAAYSRRVQADADRFESGQHDDGYAIELSDDEDGQPLETKQENAPPTPSQPKRPWGLQQKPKRLAVPAVRHMDDGESEAEPHHKKAKVLDSGVKVPHVAATARAVSPEIDAQEPIQARGQSKQPNVKAPGNAVTKPRANAARKTAQIVSGPAGMPLRDLHLGGIQTATGMVDSCTQRGFLALETFKTMVTIPSDHPDPNIAALAPSAHVLNCLLNFALDCVFRADAHQDPYHQALEAYHGDAPAVNVNNGSSAHAPMHLLPCPLPDYVADSEDEHQRVFNQSARGSK